MDRPHSADSDRPASSESGKGTTARPMGPEQLLEVTEGIYKSFNPAQVTLDTHADNEVKRQQIFNSFDDIFVRQVFYGVVRYRQFLGSLLDSFYFYNGGVANRDDRDMYKIFAYVTIFRMEELSYPSFRRLVICKDPQKMFVFFKYLFDECYLKEAVRDEWLKLYDKEFVDETIGKILVWKPDMTELIEDLEDKVFLIRKKTEEKEAALSAGAGSAAHKAAYKHAAPFNLSHPRPKPLPVEDPPPPPIRVKAVPKMKEGPTKEERAIKAAKEANRKAMEDKYPASAAFTLRTLERPSNIDRIRAEIEADMARELTFRGPVPKPAPAASTASVKLNTAAILREDALYRKKQAEEAEALKQFESELRDASDFKAWQSSMLQKDEAERAASIERRRIEMHESQEAATRARQQKVDENLAIGRMAKAEGRRIEEQLAWEREEDKRTKQGMRDTVVEGRAGIAQAAEKLAIERRLAAEEERQKQVNDAKALAEAEIRDLAEKRDIIMQLRALEKAPRIKVNEFDPTTAPDHGLMEHMSVLELRERLGAAKLKAKEEEERQRSHILQQKSDKESIIMEKASNIQRIRMAQAAQAHVRKTKTQEVQKSRSDQSLKKHEDEVLLLHSKLEAKRNAAAAERARLAAEDKVIKFEQMQQAAGASAVEETKRKSGRGDQVQGAKKGKFEFDYKQAAGARAVEETKFRELREGAKREANIRQTMRLTQARSNENTKVKAQSVRMRNVKGDQKEKTDFLAAYDEKLAQLSRAAGQESAYDFARRTNMASTQRDIESTQRGKTQSTAYVANYGKTTTNIAARLSQLQ
eukprot:gene20341-27103_t